MAYRWRSGVALAFFFFLASALGGVEWSPPTGRVRPVAIDTSGWVGPTSDLDVLEKNRLPLPGIQPLIVQPSYYTTKMK